MRLAVIQHSPWEGPGRYLLQAAETCGIRLHIFHAWRREFPKPDDFPGFLLLGGGANVDEETIYPFLKTEKVFLGSILNLDKPCLGICLGHQLLASALGAAIGPNFCTSIGAGEAFLTKDGRNHPLFHSIARVFPTFKWHSQAILTPVPRYFEILATSKECQVEAFSIAGRPHLAGIQFDNHAAHPNDLSQWYRQDQEWLQSVIGFPLTLEELLAAINKNATVMEADFLTLFSAFCKFL